MKTKGLLLKYAVNLLSCGFGNTLVWNRGAYCYILEKRCLVQYRWNLSNKNWKCEGVKYPLNNILNELNPRDPFWSIANINIKEVCNVEQDAN